MVNPAENLVGTTLAGDWKVIEKVKPKDGNSGGCFSICYHVKKGKQKAFLKVWDLALALKQPDFMEAIQLISTAYKYELELLNLCLGKKMDKVVSIIGSGQFIPEENNPGGYPISYFIFELADMTIRDHVLNEVILIDNACLMRSIHNVAVAISQLHSAGIAHQDIKPSNILLFNKDGHSKVADLGRAESVAKQSLFFEHVIAGDPLYAPPELKYRFTHPEWDVRRKATDLYHLGSLVCFYYTQCPMTSLYMTFLPIQYHWKHWKGDYQSVLPYLKEAFVEALNFLRDCLEDKFTDPAISNEILSLVKFLCDPDPLYRGHPDNRNLVPNRYSMERFITILDRLARRFESKSL
ncbi:MAG: lipopolysaccharide kinase InaA family protein [Candidatus Pseudobacter hemicellulosilyticus]|uniref:Lipopolysaccharide kinase InaA family protein n=1 Tax=Candidatus Pseudobacter hemicellulosilyticus TaxID=3121375 RepID=A0AAJ6BG74_9BACT|nr:MAG: lipopolysaccharide kinase InaA family protein [Pseudobacter sp.]